MFMTLLTYLPIPLSPFTAIGLVVFLQRRLRLRQPSAASPAGVSAAENPPFDLTWRMVTQRWNCVITGVLPILTSLAIVLLTLWPAAYIGRLVVSLADPGSAAGLHAPPWFGSPACFLGFGVVGVFVAFTAGTGVFLSGVALHATGKWLLWPELCNSCKDPDNDDPDPGDGFDEPD